MVEWKYRPTILDHHPLKEWYDKILDLDKDELLDVIEYSIKVRRESIEKEKKEGFSFQIFLDKTMVDDIIEVYYWKFVNKKTRGKNFMERDEEDE
jgi:hypothetical protein